MRTDMISRLLRGRRCSGNFAALAASLLLIFIVGCADRAADDLSESDVLPLSDTSSDSLRSVTYQTRTMGTWGTVTLVTPDSAGSAAHARVVKGAWDQVNAWMSNWSESSEISRINREAASSSESGGVLVQTEVAEVIETALRIGEQSGGAFDITVEPLVRLWGFLGGVPQVPDSSEIERVLGDIGLEKIEFDPESRLIRFREANLRADLGGIAKGYGVDRAILALQESGVEDALVDLSGNIRLIGSPAGRTAWSIGIRDPRGRFTYFAKLSLSDACMATSGNYEQFVAKDGKEYGHILDPRSGWPASGLLSATAIAPSAMEADAWATALVVLGPEGAKAAVEERGGLSAVLIEPGEGGQDVVWVSESLRPAFTIEPQAEDAFRVIYY